MENNKTFACAINCMDGRVQDAVKNYMKENYSVDYVDMVTEPGPNKILAENADMAVIENIKKRVDISVNHHGSKVVAIIGHFDCAGNPTEKEEQITHLKKAEEIVKSFGFSAKIILLWVEGDWQTVELIS
jgi:carbonic anhydrase